MFTPTADQLALLRRLDPECPATFCVLSPWFDDCACGMHWFVMWFRAGEVEFPLETISERSARRARNIDARDAMYDSVANAVTGAQRETADNMSVRSDVCSDASLIMDFEGRIYCTGDTVDAEAILAMIDHGGAGAITSPEGAGTEIAARNCCDAESRHVWLQLPPFDASANRTQILNYLRDLAARLAERGWRLGVGG